MKVEEENEIACIVCGRGNSQGDDFGRMFCSVECKEWWDDRFGEFVDNIITVKDYERSDMFHGRALCYR